MNGLIEKLTTQVIGYGLASKNELFGCSESDINSLERHFDLHLPRSYTDFLRKMGRGAGLFLQGTDVFYDRLYDNRIAFEEVLALDGNPFLLSHETFVFSSHQGYIFHYFDTLKHVEDPPVQGYREGELRPRLIAESFSEFLFSLVAEQAEGWGP